MAEHFESSLFVALDAYNFRGVGELRPTQRAPAPAQVRINPWGVRSSDASRTFFIATPSRQRYRAGHVAHHLGPNPALKRTGRYVPSASVAFNAAGRLASTLGNSHA
jgi:hypothetical protein